MSVCFMEPLKTMRGAEISLFGFPMVFEVSCSFSMSFLSRAKQAP